MNTRPSSDPTTARGAPAPMRSIPPAFVLVILVICVAIELAILAGEAGLFQVPRLRSTVIEYAAFWPGLLEGWAKNYPGQQFTMFFTYGFLHGGPLHLAMNMYTLWYLSLPIMDRVGGTGFAQIYLGAMVGGAVGYALLRSTSLPMVGASGALFGLAGAVVMWLARDVRSLKSLLILARVVAFLIGMNIVLYWAFDGHLAWETHLGGFLMGAVFGWILDPPEDALEPLPDEEDSP